jgi:uncharacterized damage-inducible protein DinB
MTDSTLVELFRHSTWATSSLLETCLNLDDDALDATTPGTYGSIRATLAHLVLSDEHFYQYAAAEHAAAPLADDTTDLRVLLQRVRLLGPRWEEVAAAPRSGAGEVVTGDGWRTNAAVVMAQSIHHAGEHRSQVCSILGALGLDVPDLAVWDHAIDVGTMVPA